uniref:Uncharacterized protein n=1 Tax=Anguilla anguilla TaxID=7936 RepID=A0A0E9WEF4_ANGAN
MSGKTATVSFRKTYCNSHNKQMTIFHKVNVHVCLKRSSH